MTDQKNEVAEMDEEVEISEAELRKVYEAALQTEVQVKKGFGEPSKMGELDDVDPNAGLADVKSGEHMWDGEEPPAAQDFTVKESIRDLIRRGIAENRTLRARNLKLEAVLKTLSGRLHEVNLFNAKVLHVNRILNSGARLTAEQRRVVLESIDQAQTIDQVTMVYETITKSFKAATAINESHRRPVTNAQKVRKSGAPDQKVLRESVERDGSNGGQFARMRQLAGLLK